MSDATERPAPEPQPEPAGPEGVRPRAAEPEADAWAKACAEDLAAEKARRRAGAGAQPGSAADELRKLVDAVADKVSSLQSSLPGTAAQGAVSQFINQAKAAVEPVIERNPDVFDHLAAAGGELLAAYRSAVQRQEGGWTRDSSPTGGVPTGDAKRDDGPEGPSAGEQIDLD
ncbi:DUF5304 domain-containing protein [Streptomyces hypolithicus]